MRIILMRHGARDRDSGGRDEHMPLSADGQKQTKQRANLLKELGVKPDLYFTSHFRHDEDTAKQLAGELGAGAESHVTKLCALTPHSPTETFEEILEETDSCKTNLRGAQVVVFVAHEPQLSWLLTRLTSTRSRPLSSAEI